MIRQLRATLPIVLLTACSLTPLGSGGDQESRASVTFCAEKIGYGESCQAVEQSNGSEIYAYASFLSPGDSVSMRVDVVQGGDRSIVYESQAATVPEDNGRLEGVQIQRSEVCGSDDCQLIVTAIVDGAEVVTAGFSFV